MSSSAAWRWPCQATLFYLIGGADAAVVLHMGGADPGDKPRSSARFVGVMRQEAALLRYLAVENDERIWSVAEVADAADQVGVPVIADTLHHALNPGGLSLVEALDRSLPTWRQRGARPKVHISSQDPLKQPGAHAFGIDSADFEQLCAALGDRDADIMVEAKGKEQALIGLGLTRASLADKA